MIFPPISTKLIKVNIERLSRIFDIIAKIFILQKLKLDYK